MHVLFREIHIGSRPEKESSVGLAAGLYRLSGQSCQTVDAGAFPGKKVDLLFSEWGVGAAVPGHRDHPHPGSL